jgi:hypothetical protein
MSACALEPNGHGARGLVDADKLDIAAMTPEERPDFLVQRQFNALSHFSYSLIRALTPHANQPMMTQKPFDCNPPRPAHACAGDASRMY